MTTQTLSSFSQLLKHIENDDVHYNIKLLLKYIILRKQHTKSNPAIKEIEKKLEKIFQSKAMFNAFVSLNLKKTKIVIYSKHYVLVYISYSYKKRRYFLERDIEVRSLYVLGVNSENEKMFIERLNPWLLTAPSQDMIIYNNKIQIYKVTDWYFYHYMFSYDKDLDIDYQLNNYYVDKVDETVRIRVQGDLVITLSKPLQTYREFLLYNVNQTLRNFVERLIANRIRDILEMYHLNCNVEANNVRVPGIDKKWSVEQINTILEKIAEIIENQMKIDDIVKEMGYNHVEIVTSVIAESNSYIYRDLKDYIVTFAAKLEVSEELVKIAVVKVTYQYVKGSGREIYDEVRISIDVMPDFTLMKAEEVVNDLYKEGIVKFDETTIRLGRHIVKCKALPISIRFVRRILNENVEFSINNLPLIVQNEMIISHPEHNEKKLFFNEPTRVVFNLIPSDEEFLARLNKYVFKSFIEESK